MRTIQTKLYYLVASFLIILVTGVLYTRIDAVLLAQAPAVVETQVYLKKTGEIPFLKEKLPETLVQQAATSSSLLAPETFAQSVTAKSAYVIDSDTNTVLFERNSQRILLPASTTKLMTALVVLDAFSPQDVVVVPELPIVSGLKYEFVAGQEWRVIDLLNALLIQSNNDAAYILALAHPGGFDGFVSSMNTKAVQLQLSNTQFDNPAGFDTTIQRSTAKDLAVLMKVFMHNELLASIVGTKTASISDSEGTMTLDLTNTHQLLGTDISVVGGKTGTTQGASQVLITQFNRNNRTIIVVVMGSDDRYLETTRLVNWVFDSYQWVAVGDLL